MAIDKVKKVHIVGMTDDFKSITQKLQALSIIHIDSMDDIEGMLKGDGGEDFSDAEAKLVRVNSAISFLRDFNKAKRGMFEPRPALTAAALEAIDEQETEKVLATAEENERQLLSIRSAISQARAGQTALEPYLAVDIRYDEIKETKNTCMFMGSVPLNVATAFEEALIKHECESIKISKTGTSEIYFIIAHKDLAETIFAELREYGFSESNLPAAGVPGKEYEQLERTVTKLERELDKAQKAAAETAKDIKKLEAYSDKCGILMQRYSLKREAGLTGRTFMLKGWVREKDTESLKEELFKLTPNIYLEAEDPGEDEIRPVAVSNAKVIKPFQVITRLYSSPSVNDVDPTTLMAPWFMFLFGMMVSDAAYGIIISLASLFFLKKAKPRGMMRQIAQVLFYGGLGTLFWGIMFGSWFGTELFPPVMFTPSSQPILMVAMCLGIGMVHILSGLAINAYNQIRQGHILDAICDNLFIMTILIMAPLLILGVSWALYGIFFGMAGILLTAGRDKKGIKKLTGGFAKLYGLTSYISDVLSYSRLFGLGLATGVIAMVFNTIAQMMTGGIIGYIAAAVILIIGHVFNIGINALGAYVHSSRLQYIEYYSKFYQGGGREFSPFGYTTKYINIE